MPLPDGYVPKDGLQTKSLDCQMGTGGAVTQDGKILPCEDIGDTQRPFPTSTGVIRIYGLDQHRR